MIEEAIEIPTADGVADGFIYREEDGRRRPGVIHMTDIGGVREAHREKARRLAAEGYTVLLPNVFYRAGRSPVFDFPRVMGEERTMKRIAELKAPLTPDAMERDGASYVDYLSGHSSVSEGAIGVVGHCFTGDMAVRTAAARPKRVAAVASFHGGGLYSDAANSTHLVLARIDRVKTRLYFGHAVQDTLMPADAIEKFNKALAAWGGKYESEIYGGARHGWTVSDSAAFHPMQAERAFLKMTTLFKEVIGG